MWQGAPSDLGDYKGQGALLTLLLEDPDPSVQVLPWYSFFVVVKLFPGLKGGQARNSSARRGFPAKYICMHTTPGPVPLQVLQMTSRVRAGSWHVRAAAARARRAGWLGREQ